TPPPAGGDSSSDAEDSGVIGESAGGVGAEVSCGGDSAAGGGVGGATPEEALATAGGGGSPAPTGPAARLPPSESCPSNRSIRRNSPSVLGSKSGRAALRRAISTAIRASSPSRTAVSADANSSIVRIKDAVPTAAA